MVTSNKYWIKLIPYSKIQAILPSTYFTQTMLENCLKYLKYIKIPTEKMATFKPIQILLHTYTKMSGFIHYVEWNFLYRKEIKIISLWHNEKIYIIYKSYKHIYICDSVQWSRCQFYLYKSRVSASILITYICTSKAFSTLYIAIKN